MGAMRLRPGGGLDTTFGKGGKRLTAISPLNVTAVQELALGARGRIVLGGFSNFKFAVVRYTPNGSLDKSFGSDGIVTTAASPDGSQANSLTLDPQGRIVAAGQAILVVGLARSGTAPNDSLLVRYIGD